MPALRNVLAAALLAACANAFGQQASSSTVVVSSPVPKTWKDSTELSFLSPTANFSQDVEYLHDLGYAHDYRLNTETALTASLSEHLSMKASYKWKRVNRPPAGFLKDDTLSSLSLLINY